MTFKQVSAIMLKRWSIILIACVLVGIGTYIGSSTLLTPRYKSTALLEVIVSVGGTPLTGDNINASMSLAQTEASLVTTNSVLADVASRYPGLTVEELSKEVTAMAKEDTQLLEIDVLDTSPTRAASLANDIASTLIRQQTDLVQPTPGGENFLVVVEPARPPLKPDQPNKALNTAAGTLLGLLLGMASAIFAEMLDTRARKSFIVTSLVNWNGLGSIGYVNPRKSQSVQANYTANAASYGTLRANLRFASRERSLHIFAVTSSLPGEGKSTIATNLAVSMARSGRKTLLIDANLRHPALHEIFPLPAHAKGFSNALLALKLSDNLSAQQVLTHTAQADIPGGFSLVPFVQTVSIPNLAVMLSGPLPPEPSELLSSDAVQRFFTVLRQTGSEVVIFDTPALLGLPDTALLAANVDALLVVIDMITTRKNTLRQAKALLDRADAYVLGFIANKQRHPDKEQSPYQDGPYKDVQKDVPQAAGRRKRREHEGNKERPPAGQPLYRPNQDGGTPQSVPSSGFSPLPSPALEANRDQVLKQKKEQ